MADRFVADGYKDAGYTHINIDVSCSYIYARFWIEMVIKKWDKCLDGVFIPFDAYNMHNLVFSFRLGLLV